jgi:hypothetical protein
MGDNFSQILRIVVAKLETTPGTAVAPASADFDVAIRNPEVTIAIPPDEENSKSATGDHGEDAAIMGTQSGTINFAIRLCKGAALTTAPKWWKFAQACGLKEKTYTATGVSLQPMKEYDDKTLTIDVYDIQQGGATPSALRYRFAGCMGNMQIGADGIGKPYLGTFSFTGKLDSIADVAFASIPALTSPDTNLPDVLLANTLTMGAVAQCASSFSLDLGNTINPMYCGSEATGIKYYSISERRPRFSYNPLSKLVATEDILTAVKASTSKAVVMNSANMEILIPVTQLLAPGIANREGYVNWEYTLRCLRDSGANANVADEASFELLIGTRV